MEVVIKNNKVKILAAAILVAVVALIITKFFIFGNSVKVKLLSSMRPAGMVKLSEEKDDFVDTPGRVNKAFNAEDFGVQGNNGWLFKQGKPTEPQKAKKLKDFDKEKYYQYDIPGIEIKKDYIHTGNGVAPILEWRVAQEGNIDIQVTYVKGVNADKNPTFPDGVGLYVYHDDQLLTNRDVEIKTDKENVVELEIKNVAVKKGESIYFVVDPKNNNAYDGGMLYAAIMDPKLANNNVTADANRKNNNANNLEDFGVQGKNGWYYQFGTSPEDAKDVSTFKDNVYLHNTSPGLEFKKDFIHPGINKSAILKWVPYYDGDIDLRLKYFKFAQNDGKPDWPDGVKIKIYRNNELLMEKDVEAFRTGDNVISYDLKKLSVKKDEKFYFIVIARGNSSWDGGRFEISIRDRSTIQDENSVVIPNDNLRTNNASVMKDFGDQGNNGWFYQNGTDDEPFDAENIAKYEKNEKYYDDTGLELKKNFVHTGAGKSAIIKWKVAQDGNIEIVSNYTKYPNNDPNPSWPDGTKVTLYHNSRALVTKNFKADRSKEIFADMSVKQTNVKKGDFITLVVNGKANNAWDGGSYTMTIKDLDNPLVENSIHSNDNEENIASSMSDFGKQGSNGWYYLQGTNPDNLMIIDEYDANDSKYFSSSAPGLEIKKDFIHPSLQSGAAMQWIVAKDGRIDILGDYVKFGHEDKNPKYPDGTTINVYHNDKILFSKKVDVYEKKDNIIPILLQDIQVIKGDKISFIVTANENTSYDGGRFNVNIQPTVQGGDSDNIDNGNRENIANLAKDFGKQGNNGWYFGYGTEADNFKTAIGYNDKDNKYYQPGVDGLEMKSDFVHPSEKEAAIYKWTVGKDGQIDLAGEYIKFKHEDNNPSWPDGVVVKIYKDNNLIKEFNVTVSNNNDIIQDIDLEKVDVKKGENFYFIISAKNNIAYDGGKLNISIYPSDNASKPPVIDDTIRPNIADLVSNFGEQGSNGWYFGYGTSGSDFALAPYNEADSKYNDTRVDGLELKSDFVHPGSKKGAVYSWITGEDGAIDLTGKYIKFKHADGNPSWPDGVKLTIYHNEQKLQEDAVSVSDTLDITKNIDIKNLEVKKGDKIYFVITANANNAWDGGKLEVSINPSDANTENPADPQEPTEPEEQPRENKANLASDFGVQGNNGWDYGYGINASDFASATYNEEESKYYQSGFDGLEIKSDFVQPAVSKGAVYKWTVGSDGKIDLTGKYTKFAQHDGNPSWPDSVKLTIYHNNQVLQDDTVPVSDTVDNTKDINIKTLDVKKGDKIYFIITANANNAWDGGKLEVSINPVISAEAVFPKSQQSALSFVGDPMPFYENGKFNVFYLDDRRDSGENGFHPWSLQTTSNFYDYKNEGVVINHSNSNADQDLALGTGSVIKDINGLYHAFFTGFNDRRSGVVSDANKANLATDFGAQGNNGWNYGYGTSDSDFAIAEGYDADNKKYYQSGLDGLEIKSDFVHTAAPKGAVYRWTVGEDGDIDLTGTYTKFAQHDGNPSWPDGVKLTIYHNNQKLQDDVVPVSDTVDNTKGINIKMLNVKKGDMIYFFITANNNNAWDGGKLDVSINPTEQAREAVMHATSTDLKNWTKIPVDTIFAAPQYSTDDFRDPYVFYNQDDNKYWMLITSRKDNKGIIARYTSDDLKVWTDAGVFFVNDTDNASLECPQLFKLGNTWYLTFSDQSSPDPYGKQIVHYRIANSSMGTFTKQGLDDSFDGNGFYAGRFEKDSEGNVYMFGWNPTKVGYSDAGDYNWGGNLVVHQIKQDANGALHATPVEKVVNALNNYVNLTEINKTQTVTKNSNDYSFSGNGYESVTFGEVNGITKITGKINTKGKNKNFGFMFNVGDSGKAPLNIVFNHQYGRLEFYNASTDGSLGTLESTKPLAINDNATLDFTIVIDDSVAVLYVNNEVAFSTRMYSMQNHKWGIFSMDSDVTFSNLQLSK